MIINQDEKYWRIVIFRPENRPYEVTMTYINDKLVTAYYKYSNKRIMSTQEIKPDVIVDYDADKHIVGIEMLGFRG